MGLSNSAVHSRTGVEQALLLWVGSRRGFSLLWWAVSWLLLTISLSVRNRTPASTFSSEFTDDRMRVTPQKRKHTGSCRCECHNGVGESLRCDHCFAYFENDWSEDITDWGRVISKRVEYRIRG